MQYLGGKQRIAKQLVAHMQPYIDKAPAYYEPFVGGGSVLAQTRHPRRYASDANAALINMYLAMQKGWRPEQVVTEALYAAMKCAPDSDPQKAFVAFACSFAAKWFGGFARNAQGKDYAASGYASLLRKWPGMEGAAFTAADYRTVQPEPGSVVYCDPPYKGTTGYGAVGKFDSEAFWQWCRNLANTCTVFVSEYGAPSDVATALEISTRTSLRTKAEGCAPRVERLYRL